MIERGKGDGKEWREGRRMETEVRSNEQKKKRDINIKISPSAKQN